MADTNLKALRDIAKQVKAITQGKVASAVTLHGVSMELFREVVPTKVWNEKGSSLFGYATIDDVMFMLYTPNPKYKAPKANANKSYFRK